MKKQRQFFGRTARLSRCWWLLAQARECDFMEKAVLASMKHDNPVYIIGKLFLHGRTIRFSVLGRYMQNHYAPG